MSRLWRAFLSRMFLDSIEPRKRLVKEASAFWADEEHVRFICEIAHIDFAWISQCYDQLWTLSPKEQLVFSSHVRKALTEEED